MRCNSNQFIIGFGVFNWAEIMRTVRSWYHGGLLNHRCEQVHILNKRNKIIQRHSRFANPILQIHTHHKILCSTNYTQHVTLGIVEETSFAWKWSYKLGSTVKSGFSRCVWNQLQVWLCFADRLRPAPVFLQPFKRMKEVFVETHGRDFLSSVRDEPRFVFVRKTRVVGMTFWLVTDRQWMQVQLKLQICSQSGPGAAAVARCTLFNAPFWRKSCAHESEWY